MTELGVLIPKAWLEGVQEVMVSRQGDRIILSPMGPERERTLMTRAEIDADLAGMASDPAYLIEASQIESEFSAAQWEALQPVETAE